MCLIWATTSRHQGLSQCQRQGQRPLLAASGLDCVCQCVSVSDCFTLCLRLFMWAKRWSELSGYFMSSLPRWLQIKEWHQQGAPLETDVLYSNGVLCVFLCVCVHLPNVFWMTMILFFRKSHCICHFSKLTALQMNSSYLNQSRRNLTDKYVS